MAEERRKTQRERDLENLTQVYRDTQKRGIWEKQKADKPPIVEPEVIATEEPQTPTRQPRKSGLEIIRHRIEQVGFTHPKNGHWLMFPAIEFEAILALERKAVAQVVLFVMQNTIGIPDSMEGMDEDGKIKRREWVAFTHRELAERVMGSPTQVNHGLKIALENKYIERREAGKTKGGVKYEYRIRWNSNDSRPRSATQ